MAKTETCEDVCPLTAFSSQANRHNHEECAFGCAPSPSLAEVLCVILMNMPTTISGVDIPCSHHLDCGWITAPQLRGRNVDEAS